MSNMPAQEKIYDLVDTNDRLVRTGTKSDARRLKLFTRSVHILLKDNHGNILVCRRPKSKKTYPNQITSSAGGHVERDESYRSAALRELREELGVSTPIRDIGRFDVINRTERTIHRLFIGKVKKIVPDRQEITSYRFVNPHTVVKNIKKNSQEFAFPFQKALDLYLKEIKKHFMDC